MEGDSLMFATTSLADLKQAFEQLGAAARKTVKWDAVLVHAARMSDDESVFGWLVAQGAIANYVDDDGCRPLHYSIQRGSAGAAKADGLAATTGLVNAGAYLEATVDKDTNSTVLHDACNCDRGHADIAELIIARLPPQSPVFNARDKDGKTPLLLLVTGYSTYGTSQERAARLIGLLVAKGADPTLTLPEPDNKPLLMIAAARNGGAAVLKALCQVPQINKDETFIDMGEPTTALCTAVQMGYAEHVRELVLGGCSLDAPCTMGGQSVTPIELARSMDRNDIVPLLTPGGAQASAETVRVIGIDGNQIMLGGCGPDLSVADLKLRCDNDLGIPIANQVLIYPVPIAVEAAMCTPKDRKRLAQASADALAEALAGGALADTDTVGGRGLTNGPVLMLSSAVKPTLGAKLKGIFGKKK